MSAQLQNIISETIAFWSQRTGQVFTAEDARQAVENIADFFSLLAEWERHGNEEDLER